MNANLKLQLFESQRGAIVSEPAIQVRRKRKGTQVWTIEKLENKLVDMRDHYRDWREGIQEVVSAFIHQGCIQLIRRDSKDIYNVTIYFYF